MLNSVTVNNLLIHNFVFLFLSNMQSKEFQSAYLIYVFNSLVVVESKTVSIKVYF